MYASYGQGFETPTFAEMAYRPIGTGLNFGLDPPRLRRTRSDSNGFPAMASA